MVGEFDEIAETTTIGNDKNFVVGFKNMVDSIYDIGGKSKPESQ